MGHSHEPRGHLCTRGPGQLAASLPGRRAGTAKLPGHADLAVPRLRPSSAADGSLRPAPRSQRWGRGRRRATEPPHREHPGVARARRASRGHPPPRPAGRRSGDFPQETVARRRREEEARGWALRGGRPPLPAALGGGSICGSTLRPQLRTLRGRPRAAAAQARPNPLHSLDAGRGRRRRALRGRREGMRERAGTCRNLPWSAGLGLPVRWDEGLWAVLRWFRRSSLEVS